MACPSSFSASSAFSLVGPWLVGQMQPLRYGPWTSPQMQLD